MERLKVSIGKTYNLGNYESLRLDVGLEIDSPNPVDAFSESGHETTFELTSGRVLAMLEDLERIERRT